MKQPKTLKKMLKEIDLFLESSDRAQDLWLILTALRGPDRANAFLKQAITGVIRSHSLPASKWWAVVGPDLSSFSKRRKEYIRSVSSSNHFIFHAQKAFEALDLKWGSCNDMEEEND